VRQENFAAILRSVFEQAAHRRRIAPKDIHLLNDWFKKFPATPRIETDVRGLQVSWCSASKGVRTIWFEVLKSAAELVARGQIDQIHECGSRTCTWMFVDTSKNHTRRWCDMRVCGNRAKVHRFANAHAGFEDNHTHSALGECSARGAAKLHRSEKIVAPANSPLRQPLWQC